MASRIVLVTGASSGIGGAAARAFVERGWLTLAGVRTARDAEALSAGGARPLILDVTDDAHVEAAVAAVEEAGGLDVLVNNAGISVTGPLETLSAEDLEHQLNVNLLGVHRMVRAMLPVLRRRRGRILQVSSTSGWMPVPFAGPYTASKQALEGYSDVLRHEISPMGVDVIVVVPGAVDTPIWGKGAKTEEEIAALPPHYRANLRKVQEYALARGRRGQSPERIGEKLVRIATVSDPRPRYFLADSRTERVLVRLMPSLPDRLMDRLLRRRLGTI